MPLASAWLPGAQGPLPALSSCCGSHGWLLPDGGVIAGAWPSRTRLRMATVSWSQHRPLSFCLGDNGNDPHGVGRPTWGLGSTAHGLVSLGQTQPQRASVFPSIKRAQRWPHIEGGLSSRCGNRSCRLLLYVRHHCSRMLHRVEGKFGKGKEGW